MLFTHQRIKNSFFVEYTKCIAFLALKHILDYDESSESYRMERPKFLHTAQ